MPVALLRVRMVNEVRPNASLVPCAVRRTWVLRAMLSKQAMRMRRMSECESSLYEMEAENVRRVSVMRYEEMRCGNA